MPSEEQLSEYTGQCGNTRQRRQTADTEQDTQVGRNWQVLINVTVFNVLYVINIVNLKHDISNNPFLTILRNKKNQQIMI